MNDWDRDDIDADWFVYGGLLEEEQMERELRRKHKSDPGMELGCSLVIFAIIVVAVIALYASGGIVTF